MLFALSACVLSGAIWLIGKTHFEGRREAKLSGQVNEIVSLMGMPAAAPFDATVDTVRIFINDHSQTRIDDAFHAMRGNTSAFAAGIIAHAKDPKVERVHMECSTRANLMTRILRQMGIETRMISIFRTRDDFSSHSFLDVYNPDVRKWQTVDPDYDLIGWRRQPARGCRSPKKRVI